MLQEKCITLRQAAQLAKVSLEEMMSLAMSFDILLIDYTKEDLKQELDRVI